MRFKQHTPENSPLRRWFAWRPVVPKGSGLVVWLEWLYRKRVRFGYPSAGTGWRYLLPEAVHASASSLATAETTERTAKALRDLGCVCAYPYQDAAIAKHCPPCRFAEVMEVADTVPGDGEQGQWCPIHLKFENAAEWSACDDELYAAGFRNVGGQIVPP